LANREDRKNIRDERIEDTTMYGEFISSFNQWVTLDRQKKKTEFLEEISSKFSPKKNDKVGKETEKKPEKK
jgi:hypothetical protein